MRTEISSKRFIAGLDESNLAPSPEKLGKPPSNPGVLLAPLFYACNISSPVNSIPIKASTMGKI